MEARGRRLGGGFPGYNGPALPRAMRSSRGRGETARKNSGYGGRSGFFELLATVAGQILQNDSAAEAQESGKFEREILKKKCTESVEVHPKGSEWPLIASFPESSCTVLSCLDSLGLGITDDQEKSVMLIEKKKDGSTADSIHCVVSRPILSRSIQDELVHTLFGLDKNEAPDASILEESSKTANTPACAKQTTLSVLDNDEIQPAKCDNDVGHTAYTVTSDVLLMSTTDASDVCLVSEANASVLLVTSSVDTDEHVMSKVDSSEVPFMKKGDTSQSPVNSKVDTCEVLVQRKSEVENLQIPKTEQVLDETFVEDCKEEMRIVSRDDHTTDMDIDMPKYALKQKLSVVHGQDAGLSDDLELPKGEPLEGDIPPVCTASSAEQAESMTVLDIKNHVQKALARKNDVSCWRRGDASGNDDERFSGIELHIKGIGDIKKTSQLTDLVLGKGQAEHMGKGFEFSLENVFGKSRESISVKEASGKDPLRRVFPDKLTKKLKDSYVKGMKARKVVKMVKRGRVSGSRTKRKHAEMDAAGDSDETHGKKSYFTGISYTRQRTARGLAAKRKKLVDGAPSPSSDGLHVNTNNLMDLAFDRVDGEPPASAAKLRSAKAASVASSPTAKGPSSKFSKKPGEPHVKFSIKSFTVPELSVDLPETATVSILKIHGEPNGSWDNTTSSD